MHAQADIFIPLIIFGAIYLTIKVISDNRLRHKLIERGLVDEKASVLFTKHQTFDNPLQSLKWGLVLVGIGLGLFVQVIVPGINDAVSIGIMFIMAGIAFIVYHVIAKKDPKKDIE